MKSQALGTRLRLFKIFRWLSLVVCIKLFVLMALLVDLPGHMQLEGFLALGDADSVSAEEEAAIPGGVNVAYAAGLTGDEAEGGDKAVDEPCPEPMDPLLRENLERKQIDLDLREKQLTVLESRVNEKLEEMQALEGRIQMMLKDAQGVQDEKMLHLVDVYTNMKAKQAGQVLETLDERTAVRILAAMRGRQAGEILNNLTPEKAARLSEMLTTMQLPFN